jgi:hypothetical protein
VSAQTTIAKLRDEVRKLRAENPEVAKLMDERDMLAAALKMYEARERELSGAITKVLGGVVTGTQTDDPKLPLGQYGDPGPVAKAVLAQIAANESAALKARDEKIAKARPRRVTPAHDMTDQIRKRRAEVKSENG